MTINPIPKLPSNRFLFENWNREFCANFYDMYENKEFIRSKIIGWCPASKVFARKRECRARASFCKPKTW